MSDIDWKSRAERAEAALAAYQRAEPPDVRAIRERAERWPAGVLYIEEYHGGYLAGAHLWDGRRRLLDLDEPTEDERAVLQYVEQSGKDVRALLMQLAVLRSAARPAADLLRNLEQLPLDPVTRAQVHQTLAPLEAALAVQARGG